MSSKRSLQILALLKTANKGQQIDDFSKNETEEKLLHSAGKLLLAILIFYFEFDMLFW